MVITICLGLESMIWWGGAVNDVIIFTLIVIAIIVIPIIRADMQKAHELAQIYFPPHKNVHKKF